MPLTDIATLTIEIDTTSAPDTTTPSYSTVIPVDSVEIGPRGRHIELDTVQPTRSTVYVDNSDGTYTPLLDVGVDALVRVRAALTAAAGGGTYTIAAGVLEAVPETVTGFDAAQTQFKVIDYLDALGTRTLHSAYVEQTLYEAPTNYIPLGDAAGSASVGDLITAASYPVRYAYGVGSTTAGTVAFGVNPLYGSLDDTTGASFLPHTTSGTPDGAAYVQLGVNGVGTFLSGSVWCLRLTFESVNFATSGYLFYQSNRDSTGTDQPLSVYQSAGGYLVIAWPNGSSDSWTSSAPMNDGATYTVSLFCNGAHTYVMVNGATVYVAAVATTLNTVGVCTVGSSITPRGYMGEAYSGQIQHVALWSGSAPSTSTHYSAATGFPYDTADNRIRRVLGWCGYTGDTSAFETGATLLAPQTCAGKTAAQECLDTAAAEDGIFYVKGTGLCHFRARSSRYAQSRVVSLNSTNATSTVRGNLALGSYPVGGFRNVILASTILPIHNWPLSFQYDRQHMVNDLYATRPGGPTIRVTDPTSRTKHRPRNGGYTAASPLSFPVQTDAELFARASWYLTRYKDPQLRVDEIQIRPFTVLALAVYASTLEPLDRVGADNLPANAPASSLDFIIESIGQPKLENGDWICSLTLSPFIQTFIPGDPVYGLVGVYPMPY